MGGARSQGVVVVTASASTGSADSSWITVVGSVSFALSLVPK